MPLRLSHVTSLLAEPESGLREWQRSSQVEPPRCRRLGLPQKRRRVPLKRCSRAVRDAPAARVKLATLRRLNFSYEIVSATWLVGTENVLRKLWHEGSINTGQQQELGVHLGGTCCAVFCTAVWLSPPLQPHRRSTFFGTRLSVVHGSVSYAAQCRTRLSVVWVEAEPHRALQIRGA